MQEILKLFRERESFVIAGHSGPDGDSIGSCFGLALALEKMGKKVHVMLEPYAQKYNVIPGRHFLYPRLKEDFPIEVFVALDCADYERLGVYRPLFDRAEFTVCIDHHETNEGFAQFSYIESTASSTSEMVFRIIEQLTEPTADIASAIYAGIVSDTGGFRYGATHKSTMEIAARLMDMGIPFTEIYNELMHRHRFSAGKAMGVVLMNAMQSHDGRIVYSYITRDMLADINADPSDLDGVVEYLMSTRGALSAVLIYERHRENEVKVSLRSKGPNVGRVAKVLGGGGHALAAGATTKGNVAEIMSKTIPLIMKEIMTYTMEVNPGIINVYKEKGYTSHDVVAILRKIFGKQIGHTGTLDPEAEGVLPVCLGRATKLSNYITAESKTYVAEVILGVTTDTGDMTGAILTQKDAINDKEKIIAAVESFKFENRGQYMQIPPMYSAVKINGQKLYELARQGKTVKRPARPVVIHDIKVINFADDRFTIEVTCSKGTYIRTLCEDIGNDLGCGAAMGHLKRTQSGVFSIENAYTLAQIQAAANDYSLDDMILPVNQVLPYPMGIINPDNLVRARNGNPLLLGAVEIDKPLEDGEKCWLKDPYRITGLFRKEGKKLRVEVML
ncbi:MAG: tRNA pseudouridine(55) synthase TruB [Defluviitaleaceae bacterium]|nr:tRNA pseudouridine(55) synthase TruB [Defluviitaleaceae bacterium]